MKKKIMFLILLLLIIASASATYAYILRESATETIITFGSLKMKLHYYTLDGGDEVEIKEDKNLNIIGTSSLSRILRLENVGGHSMYVRVNFDIRNDNDLDMSDAILIDALSDWVYKDGYYYYKYELKPGEMTTKLMNEIIFDSEKISKDYRGNKINFRINAEAVQAEHNNTDVLELNGWPK